MSWFDSADSIGLQSLSAGIKTIKIGFTYNSSAPTKELLQFQMIYNVIDFVATEEKKDDGAEGEDDDEEEEEDDGDKDKEDKEESVRVLIFTVIWTIYKWLWLLQIYIALLQERLPHQMCF